MTLRTIRAPSGFLIVPIHYSLDPAKDADWYAEARRGYTEAAWNREYEIDFSSQAGNPVYPSFRPELHLFDDIMLVPTLPLCLCVDFNVAPMVWEIAQIHGQRAKFLDEIVVSPASVDRAMVEFRNRYPGHPAGVRIYGDASGNNRSAQTAGSDYDLMRLGLKNYPAAVEFRVPMANPGVKNRVNAVNRRLLLDGQPFVQVSRKCEYLVADFEEVVWAKNGTDILKVNDPKDPYSNRTHGSDGAGYMIAREWPVVSEAMAAAIAAKKKPAGPLKYGRVIGGMK